MTHQFTDEQIEAVMNEVYRNVRHAHPQKIERSLVRLILEARAERDALRKEADLRDEWERTSDAYRERNAALARVLEMEETIGKQHDHWQHAVGKKDDALARVKELEATVGNLRASHTHPRLEDVARIAALEAEVNKLAAQRDAACVLGDHRIDALEAENADMRAQCVAVSNSFTNAKRIAENERLRGALEQDELRLGGNEPATEWHQGRLYTLTQLRAAMESDDE